VQGISRIFVIPACKLRAKFPNWQLSRVGRECFHTTN